jgi:predicted MFS family arabinose efflux permease
LVWSNLAAQSAEQIALAAAPIVAVLMLGAGAGQTGLLQTALTLPFLLFAIPAGLLADRMSRRSLMVGAELVRAFALLVVFGLIEFNQLGWTWLALLGFVAVCGTVAFSTAAPALIPSLVAPNALPIANSRIELARTIAYAAGPALGGILVGWIGAAVAFAVAALLSIGAAFVLSGVEEPVRERSAQRHPLQDAKEGAVFVFRHPLLAPVFVTQFVFNTAYFLLLAIIVPYAVNHLGLSADGVGVMLGMVGVGMVVGALFAPRIIALLPFGMVVAIGPLAGVAASIIMALTIAWPTPALASISLFLLGCGPILWVISTTTLRQTVTPESLLGRVSAVNIMAYGARPLGSAIGALAGGLYGAEACLLIAVLGFAAQALIICLSPAVRIEQHQSLDSRDE